MPTKYNVNYKKIYTNYNDTRLSAPIIMDVWLEEGNITKVDADTLEVKGRDSVWPGYSFASRLTKGDLVQLSVDTAFTYAALQGVPIVSAVASTGGIVGEILNYPVNLRHVPPTSAAADSVAERVAGKYYRIAPVRLEGLWYDTVLTNGTSAIAVGDRLTYDVSDEKYIKDDAGTSPLIACHYSAADNTYVGALRLPGVITTQA